MEDKVQKLTHWKKHLDSRYISGEDLQFELNGLKKEMVVVIDRFNDVDTFNQKLQSEEIKTGLYLKTLDGKPLYKPVILNNVNARFCTKEFGSEFVEHWVNKPIILYAQPDKRFNFVARFKKYFAPQISDVEPIKLLKTSKTKEELQANWSKLSKQEQALPTVVKVKDELKVTL